MIELSTGVEPQPLLIKIDLVGAWLCRGTDFERSGATLALFALCGDPR